MTEEPILIAVRDRLQLDDGIAASLAANGANGPAVYYFERNPQGSVYPCIVLRPWPARPDHRFNGPGQLIGNIILDLEIWTQSRASSAVDRIHNLILPLLHNQILSLPVAGAAGHEYASQLYQCQMIADSHPPTFDASIKAWAGFYRYQFTVARGF